ncbi:MAG: protein-glutamate O-methyltransferase CheR [Actinomycetota bacterium]|nr:protein-glutamate O-methyltransferase CheR [Actinomycetota bacterium]
MSSFAAVEDLEIALLLEAIYSHYGFDFRGYAPASLKRRLRKKVRDENLRSLSGLQELVLHDPAAMERLVLDLSVNVTSMFRDPSFYSAFREKVVPLLKTYPFIRIWNAGCSTGEEVYSMAIVLHEEGLYERTRIYATDINDAVLGRAQVGRVGLDKMREYTSNYIHAGGKRAFSEYYVVEGGEACLRPALLANVVFAQHNLVSDGSFNEFNAIVCRNVMIYFSRSLQDHVHSLLYESLTRFGVLALGRRESLKFTAIEDRYQELDAGEKLYRKVA